MSQETRYFRVGLFVLLGTAMVVGAALLIGGGRIFERVVVFETVFRESVQGLEVGSPVRFRGVKLGTVSSIGFVRDHYRLLPEDEVEYGSLVLVRFQGADEDTGLAIADRQENLRAMADRGLRLRITPMGITGTSFIEADYLDPEAFPPIELPYRPKVLFIPSARSRLGQFASSAEVLIERINELDVKGFLANLDTLVLSLNQGIEDLDPKAVGRGLNDVLQEVERTFAALRGAVEGAELDAVSRNAQGVLRESEATLARLRKSAEGASYDLEVVLENLRVTTENLRDLTETLRRQPSLLLRSAPPEDPTP